jgi:hypothetical protein
MKSAPLLIRRCHAESWWLQLHSNCSLIELFLSEVQNSLTAVEQVASVMFPACMQLATAAKLESLTSISSFLQLPRSDAAITRDTREGLLSLKFLNLNYLRS